MDEKTKNSLRIHFGLFLAETLCISGFIVEILRATSGNGLSWAYVFEWPLFGAYAIYMWRRLLKEAREGVSGPPVSSRTNAALDEYNAYLDAVHHSISNTKRSRAERPNQPTSQVKPRES